MAEMNDSQNAFHFFFGEGFASENFFSTAHLEELQKNIEEVIDQGVPLIFFTGEEGSGKTVLCHRLHSLTWTGFQTIFFDTTVDSFEDVVRAIATELGIHLTEEDLGQNVEHLIEELIIYLKNPPQPVLVIFDESENIYLATLERIRKLMDRIYLGGATFHLFFSGRSTLLENFEHLSICDFQVGGEVSFETRPLSDFETEEYVQHGSQMITGQSGVRDLTPEILEEIVAAGKGNFRTINMLADEAMRDTGDDTSFMVLLENVKEDADVDGEDKQSFALLDLLTQYKPYLPWAGGLVAVLLLVVLFFSGPEEQIVEQPPVKEIPEISESVAKTEDDLNTTKIIIPGAEVVVKRVTPRKESLDQGPALEIVAEPVNPAETVEEEFLEIPAVAIVPETAPEKEELVPVKEIEPVVLTPEKFKKELVVEQAPQGVAIVEIQAVPTMKIRPGIYSVESTQAVSVVSKPKKKTKTAMQTMSADTIYRSRVAAGSGWQNGRRDEKYTVQLMVLTASLAESNIKGMLAQDKYRQEAGNFYIFEKSGKPEQILVYYGVYSSMARARLAKNSLPQFLRDHKPYAISIKNVMAKKGI
jgi:septal ring-binding cell division protein DamX/type II secretory pathway predicted ATPase ExeA